jgi:hypothetical protein
VFKSLAASKAAKALGLCVCPVIAGGVALKVPQVREAVHAATAPPKSAKPKRSRMVKRDDAANGPAACPEPTPVRFSAGEIGPFPMPAPEGVTILADFSPPETATGLIRSAALADPTHLNGGGVVPGFGFGTGVPEPTTWLQIIAGLGLAGAALRAGRTKVNGSVS